MKKYTILFSAAWQRAIAYRGASVVFVLLSFLNILLAILVLSVALRQPLLHAKETFSSIISYFVVVTVVLHLALSATSESIAERYIKRGELSFFLLKPFPFLLYLMISDIPWRIIQFIFSLLPLVGLLFFFRDSITVDIQLLFMAALVLPFSYVLSFFVNVCFGMLAFWFEDANGYLSVLEVFVLLFTGVSLPLTLFPPLLRSVAEFLPFHYMVYFPVSIALHRLPEGQMPVEFFGFITWFIVLSVGVWVLWRKGLRKFTAEGI